MQRCEYSESCHFYGTLQGSDSATAAFMRVRYCQGRPESCARFIAARRVGPETVPPELHPTDAAKVEVLG